MWNAALLASIEDAAAAVLTMTEGLEEEEFQRSRITRSETRRQVDLIACALDGLDPDARRAVPEIDWDAWQRTHQTQDDETLWFAVRSLVPATLMWLRVYRRNHPDLFAFKLDG
jgi:uncharacterized protein with HEPN domain